MIPDNRIEVADEDLFPVQAFFNAVGDSSFVRVVKDMKRGVGASVNDCHCEFPGDLDPDEEPFEGVRFILYEDEITIGLEDLERFLVDASMAQVRRCPEQREELSWILGRPL